MNCIKLFICNNSNNENKCNSCSTDMLNYEPIKEITKRYCFFLEDIYEGKNLIWQKHEYYEITYETLDEYFFGKPINNGIDKEYEGIKFIIVKK